mmetsp:Transcript_5364/g.20113  ORF Transcript_5364/g.20113 Transcript_5364/m.20113 type:complete len:219 (-) Transcript_5364:1198-1854(-)
MTTTPLRATSRSAAATTGDTTPSLFNSVPSKSRASTSHCRLARPGSLKSRDWENKTGSSSTSSSSSSAARLVSPLSSRKSCASPRSPAVTEAIRPLNFVSSLEESPGAVSRRPSALSSAVSAADIAAASASPSSWSIPARCAMPCTRSTLVSVSTSCRISIACRTAVSSEITQSPKTTTSPKVSAGKESTSVAWFFPRHSKFSSAMCASVHSATESST